VAKMTKSMAKKVGKKKKDPKAPKKWSNAFIYFSKEMRKQVKEENPDMESTDIMRHLGKLWSKVKGTRKAEKYDKMVDEDKKRYEKEMEGYTPGEGYEKKEKKSPKSKSAYILWCADNRARVKEENDNPEFGEMSKLLGTEWKKVKKEEGKEFKKYVKKAAEEKEKMEKEKESVKKVDKKKPNKKKSVKEESEDEDDE